MLPRILITRRWFDDDVAQLAFEVCDGVSVFVNEAYVSLDWGTEAAAALRTLVPQIYGGMYNLQAGDGGPEYASGAFYARFHWYKPDQLLISTRQQGDFFDFKRSEVAPQATMYLRTEPALLDRFIASLPSIDDPKGGPAELQCVPLKT